MSEYRQTANEEGCLRPFTILCQMSAAERNNIRELLEFDFGENQGHPEAESWDIIGCDLRGLQARSHFWYETLNPLAANCTWREIVYRCLTHGLKVTRVSEDCDELTLERQFIETLQQRMERQLKPQEQQEIDQFLANHPGLFSAGAVGRLTVLLLFRSAKRSSGKVGIYTATQLAVWLNQRLGLEMGAEALAAITAQSLKLLVKSLNVILWAWLLNDMLGYLLGTSFEKVIPVVTIIVMRGNLPSGK